MQTYDVGNVKFEYKYLVPNTKLGELRSLLKPYVEQDEYMKLAGKEGYTVRSIYFDTPSYGYYHEKRDGIKKRKKVRVRGYNDFDPGSVVFLEIKRKNGKRVRKNRAPVRYADLGRILSNGRPPELFIIDDGSGNAVYDARRFLFHLYKYCLQPTVLVVYRREAYFGRFDRRLRLTFDKELRGAINPELDSLYEEKNIRYSISDHFVFEVKFRDAYPMWLKKITTKLGLRLESFSKFTTCIEEHVAIEAGSRQMIHDFIRCLRI